MHTQVSVHYAKHLSIIWFVEMEYNPHLSEDVAMRLSVSTQAG